MKTRLLYTTILAFILLSSLHLSAQVGINTDGSSPNSSAMLDVKSANKGVLVPQIALTGTLDVTTIASPATSLLIYNTATSGTSPNNVTPGYYYWSGTAWTRLSVFAGGAGTTNYLPKWNSTSALGNSLLFDNGTNVGIGTATPGARLDVAGRIWQTGTGHSVFFGEGAGTGDDLTNNENVFVGYQAGKANTTGAFNSALGSNALSANTTGQYNVATGPYALFANTTSSGNTAHGCSALRNNSSGANNTAVGINVLSANTTGGFNTASGGYALTSNTTGETNTADGGFALMGNSSGSWNTSVGYQSMHNNSTASYNTACGANALYSNTTGLQNTALGDSALYTNTIGNNNMALGFKADVASNNLSNATAIGANAIVGQSNSLVLGGTGSNAVNVGIGTTTPAAKLDVIGAVKITDGTQGASKVLTSDANGLASWQTPAAPPASWLLAGNSGTVSGTNFIGTTDNIAFDIRTNNTLKTRITTKGAIETYGTGQSVFIGESAGANDDLSDNQNVFIGYQAGKSNTTGLNNSANGAYALTSNTTGYSNVAVGSNSLNKNTIMGNNVAVGDSALYNNGIGASATPYGTGNTGVGSKALRANGGGYYNTANGYEAMFYNIGGFENTAVGYQSLLNNQGKYNTAVGVGALSGNTSGFSNTAVGLGALMQNSTGLYNTSLGMNALGNNVGGTYNTAVGYLADVSLMSSQTNVTVIGANAIATDNNQVRLGNSSVATFYCQGAWAGTVGSSPRALYVDNTGKIGYTSSSARYKDNIVNMESVDWLYKLRPVNYTYKTDESKVKQYGLIAEEVEKVKPEFVSYNKDGSPETVSYSFMISPLIKAVQEQKALIESQQKEIDELKLMVKELAGKK